MDNTTEKVLCISREGSSQRTVTRSRKKNDRILVCAQSNAAVDEILARVRKRFPLSKEGDIVRIGRGKDSRSARINEEGVPESVSADPFRYPPLPLLRALLLTYANSRVALSA